MNVLTTTNSTPTCSSLKLDVSHRNWKGRGLLQCVASEDFVYELQVAPAARRHGLGGTLLDKTVGDAAVELEVHERNEGARAFYDARGFKQSAETRGGMLLLARA